MGSTKGRLAAAAEVADSASPEDPGGGGTSRQA
jgi:hypothetical protein